MSDKIANEVKQFINTDLLENQGEDLQIDTPLLELGIIDSLSMVSLLSFINKQYDIAIMPEDAIPDNFKDIQSIANTIVAKSEDEVSRA